MLTSDIPYYYNLSPSSLSLILIFNINVITNKYLASFIHHFNTVKQTIEVSTITTTTSEFN